MVGRRSPQESIEHANELADVFEQYEPSAEDLVQDALGDAREG